MLIDIRECLCYLHFLEINKRQDCSKYMVSDGAFDGAFAASLKVLNVTNLFDRPVILFNLPVLVMDLRKVVAFKRDFLWQVNHVVATLVF